MICITFGLDTGAYNSGPLGFPLPGDPHKEKQPMKRALRMLILVVGVLCTYTALVTPVASFADEGAPPPMCPLGSGGNCR